MTCRSYTRAAGRRLHESPAPLLGQYSSAWAYPVGAWSLPALQLSQSPELRRSPLNRCRLHTSAWACCPVRTDAPEYPELCRTLLTHRRNTRGDWISLEVDLHSFTHGDIQAKLKPLLSRADLIITRRLEWANVIFGFQQETTYIIKDPGTPRRKSPVGLIREKSNFILRQLLKSRRPFVAEFTDHKGKEIFTVRRPFRWINSSIYTEVDGKEIGVVHSRWHLWRRVYDLYLGNRQFAVVENPGFWNWTFTLLDDNDNVVAKIDCEARGIGLEVFTEAHQYAIRFGVVGESYRFFTEDMDKVHTFLPLALPERAVALALAVSLDRDYYSSRRLGWGIRAILGA